MTPRLLRTAVAAATGLSLVAGGAAVAAPKKPVCNLLTDDPGDGSATAAAPGQGPNDEALDIRSVDIATDAKNLTAVVRVAKASTTAVSSPNGFRFLVLFDVKGADAPIYVSAASAPGLGQSYDFGTDAEDGLTDDGDAKGVFDTAKNEIRITASLDALTAVTKKRITKGTKLTGLAANSSRDFVAVIAYADRAEGGTTYVAGTRSCVAVGK